MEYNFDLTTLWAFIIAFAVFAYVVMDGFDLGIGILFPTLHVGEERNTAMNSIAPVWDGNETWLILGGGGLLAAFPLAYAIIMPAIYVPIISMLLALIFRGVAFEFRWRDPGHRPFWDGAFFGGSLIAALSQGVALGAILQGIRVDGRSYGGGWWDWLTPFSVVTGVSVAIGYALLGSTWLIMRTEGELQAKARRYARWFAGLLLVAIAVVSGATPYLSQAYFERWFNWPNVLFTAQVPLLVLITSVALYFAFKRKRERSPFILSLFLFALTFAGLGISLYPYIVPDQITIWEAAAPEKSQVFMLVGAAVLIPLILAYTSYAYWVFRGKVGHEGYH
ncbi:cytochrome d ubiquinol oxidase subunit II [Pedomonas mirosovicensis]|uniref:cytochrome d ubiquinol oxidase subunit II n=1 Tax=Pedomonas mirosovicensis TaxID=2908641 RepID=UPI00216AB1DE|nr:cytochrome d ubiquinol oxidase subunit II [Pedomonas mirosovicensis]MCH8686779.1 cytochrome d ubiquinol oxidase subunit II [Pedomonas mirosovicensis]